MRPIACPFLLLVLLLNGCGSPTRKPDSVARFQQGDYRGAYAAQLERLDPDPEAGPVVPAIDRPLDAMRAGTLATIVGDRAAARDFLHHAIVELDGLAAGDGPFGFRGDEPYRGFPYERMYVHTLYGLLSFAVGGEEQYRTALTAFRRALVEDEARELDGPLGATDAGRALLERDDDPLAADSAINRYLGGLSLLRLGDRDGAQQALAAARDDAESLGRLGYPVPPDDLFEVSTAERSNVLVVVASGRGPVKVGGDGRIRLEANPVVGAAAARILVDGEVVGETWVFDDVFHQATTRGPGILDLDLQEALPQSDQGRPADRLHARLALAILAQDEADYAGASALGLDLGASLPVDPESGESPPVDRRRLEFLPATFQVLPLSLPPGATTLELEFIDAFGSTLLNVPPYRFELIVPEPGAGQVVLFAQDGRNEVEPEPEPAVPDTGGARRRP